jgi:hypothetical protein
MKTKHEKAVCKIIADFIANRKNQVIRRTDYPDEKERNTPAVDMLIECSGVEIVLEHTKIESYSEQIADGCRIKKLLGPIKSKLEGQLPLPGHYVLSTAIGAVKGAKQSKLIRERIIEWIEEKAPLLKIGSPDVAPEHYIREKPTGVPFEVTLCRWPGRDGKFSLGLFAPEALEDMREKRISKALEEKCPKLCKAKGSNRISILLLESDDISLANPFLISRALVKEIASRPDVPDEIYLVETEIKPWLVSVLKEVATLFSYGNNLGPYELCAATE